MKTKWLYLVAAITLIISAVAVKPTMAYFTDTTKAEGSFQIKIGDGDPEIHEEVVEMTKKITIKNTGDYPIFVRAKAIYPDDCTITFEPTGGWSDGKDGYYYYKDPVGPKESTPADTPLTLKITRAETSKGDFNVVIIQEATRVSYDEKGNVDWSGAVQNQDSYNLGQ